MAWSVPCPECGTLNEPDGSGAVLCARCGRFSRVPLPGAKTATYGGMGEIEAHLTELGIPYTRVSDTSIQVVRQIGPQTVHATIDSARTIHIVSSTGVADLSVGDSAGTRLHFDPDWKERYDFDLALEDKTFALMNAAGAGLDIPDDLPTPPLPGPPVPDGPPVEVTQRAAATSMLEALRQMPEEEPAPSLAQISAMIPKRVDAAPPADDTQPHALSPSTGPQSRAREDTGGLPIPSVILPSTPDGKPPVLTPSTAMPAVSGRATPIPPPLGAAPPRPSGRVHIGNGVSRDVIQLHRDDGPEVPPESLPELDLVPETPLRRPEHGAPPAEEEPAPAAEDAPTLPSPLPPRSSGERRAAPPVLHRFDEPTLDTVKSPTAPRAMAVRARRSSAVWAGLLGLAVGAAVAFQVATPARLAALLPPTATSEVRAGAQAARRGDVDSALAHFQRAAELDPRSAPAWRNLGVAYALKGDQVKSAEAYRKYLELEQDPEQARAVRTLLGEP